MNQPQLGSYCLLSDHYTDSTQGDTVGWSIIATVAAAGLRRSLSEHIVWAAQRGALDSVARFLRELAEEDWFHIGE